MHNQSQEEKEHKKGKKSTNSTAQKEAETSRHGMRMGHLWRSEKGETRNRSYQPWMIEVRRREIIE